MPSVQSLDHMVLTVTDMDATLAFYCNVLGMGQDVFHAADGSTRTALTFGEQKINLHAAARPFAPHAAHATSGSADICFLSDTTLTDWQAHLKILGIPVEAGPIARTGAKGPIISLYIRDPDGNLIEVSNHV
jgi:catechol 2,3-dioxygenase-like lactoylglutathione lyase family enzyme